ncbi:hypothetical protein LCGC14_2400190, partial [marine sediment metagenome]
MITITDTMKTWWGCSRDHWNWDSETHCWTCGEKRPSG